MFNVAKSHTRAGEWMEAQLFYEEVLKCTESTNTDQSSKVAAVKNNLAQILRHQRRLKEAEELQVQVVETKKRLFSHEQPVILSCVENLATIYSDQGRWKEAEE
jgi:hypothetical protein